MCKSQFHRFPFGNLAFSLLATLVLCGSVQASWLDDVGWTDLSEILGDQMPTGNGVYISQVEAGQAGNQNRFFPETDPNNTTHFDDTLDPFGQNPTFVNGSAGMFASPIVSTHATNVVAAQYYGDKNGQAPGANTIVVYQADDYLRNFLNCGSGSLCGTGPPDDPEFVDPADSQTKQYVVQNHSWAGTLGDNYDVRALRKIDYLADVFDVTMVVGVSNGDLDPNTNNPPHPALRNLLAHGYNSLAVGVSEGDHAIGPTSLDYDLNPGTADYGNGRQKPSIVVPLGTASSATATVSGAATLLHEVVDDPLAARSETMRAIIMAGATKTEFVNFIDPGTLSPDPWDRTTSQPLDNILGAGELNVMESYFITEGGRAEGTTSSASPGAIESYGWDHNGVTSTASRFYEFEIPAGSIALDFSVMLSWNAVINPSFLSETVADLSLTLRDGTDTIIESSDSADDNNEHIYIGEGQTLEYLTPGIYTLEVAGNITQDFGLAWRTSTAFGTDPLNLSLSADFDENGVVDGLDFFTWQQNLGILVNATHSQGDADGDGDVDDIDLAIYEIQYGTSPVVPTIVGIPEPGTWMLALLAVLSGTLRTRHARRPLA